MFSEAPPPPARGPIGCGFVTSLAEQWAHGIWNGSVKREEEFAKNQLHVLARGCYATHCSYCWTRSWTEQLEGRCQNNGMEWGNGAGLTVSAQKEHNVDGVEPDVCLLVSRNSEF